MAESSWTPAEERAAKALAAAAECDWDSLDDDERGDALRLARAALSAAAEGEPEYQWGVRAIHDGTVLGSDSEHDARQLHAMGGWELVRWRKAGPVEVVDE